MLNSKVLLEMTNKIANKIKGEWLIFGGSALYLLNIESRATMDVDVASFYTSTNEDTLKLMTIAEELHLPVETINQAGAFFLNKIENWQSRCQVFKKGKLGKVYIPGIDLYIELKSSRMSESDLTDCLAYLEWSKKKKINFSTDSILENLRKSISVADTNQKKRIHRLIEKLNE